MARKVQLVSPAFINHEGKPIFSCDIHPDGLRFATGGQGTSSGRIAIWNLRTVLDAAFDDDENVPKCLCLLDNHAHCVNAVRWSHSGKNLASGGDDKLIMIWVKSGEGKVNASGVPIGLEQWRCAHTLSSHESDVLDVAWGPNDTRLATCSVDNTVIIWNMDGKPAVLTKLFGHTGLVKGVAWDPVGEFLASQSDDRSVRIWRTSDWKQQVAITEPFKECGDLTHVLRLDWSPDGLYVVSANASNSGGPTAQIIDRATDAEKKCWPSEMDFVGHRKAVTCVKFNRNLMVQSPSDSKFCLVATGSRDRSIAVWSTQQKRPIVAMKNCFMGAVVDMSWGLDGQVLMACSWDGSVMFFSFKENEIGRPVSADEKTAALENLYGKRLVHGKVEPIMECPELLDVKPEAEKPATVKKPQPAAVVKSVEPVILAKQIEIKRADGKRRITPISLPKDAPTNLCSFSSSSNVKTKIVVEQLSSESVVPAAHDTVMTRPVGAGTVDVSPAKRKKLSLVTPQSTAAFPVVASMDPRPVAVYLKALGLDGSVDISITGSDSSFIVVENQKEPVLAKIRRETRKDGIAILWENVLGHPVLAAKSNMVLSVFLCSDRSVHVLGSNSGTPVRLPLLLPGYPACVNLNAKQQLCVVTTCGFVIVWDLTKNKQIMRDSTLKGELLADPTSFSMCRLQVDAYPLVILNNGRSFSYSEMGWQLLTDVKCPVWNMASQKDIFSPATLGLPYRGLIGDVKAATAAPAAPRHPATVQSATTSQCSTSLMYQQLLACDIFGSELEYKSSLIALVKQLSQTGAVPQLRDLLSTKAEPRGLLKDCLNVMKGHLNCQRLYSEMAGPVACIDEESLGPPAEMDCT